MSSVVNLSPYFSLPSENDIFPNFNPTNLRFKWLFKSLELPYFFSIFQNKVWNNVLNWIIKFVGNYQLFFCTRNDVQMSGFAVKKQALSFWEISFLKKEPSSLFAQIKVPKMVCRNFLKISRPRDI